MVPFKQFLPTVTINPAADQPDPTNGPIRFHVQFRTSVTGFDPNDIDPSGAPAQGFGDVEVPVLGEN